MKPIEYQIFAIALWSIIFLLLHDLCHAFNLFSLKNGHVSNIRISTQVVTQLMAGDQVLLRRTLLLNRDELCRELLLYLLFETVQVILSGPFIRMP
jgi:hypothetical protein